MAVRVSMSFIVCPRPLRVRDGHAAALRRTGQRDQHSAQAEYGSTVDPLREPDGSDRDRNRQSRPRYQRQGSTELPWPWDPHATILSVLDGYPVSGPRRVRSSPDSEGLVTPAGGLRMWLIVGW